MKVIFADANPQTQRQASSRKRVQAGDLFGQHGGTVQGREQNGGHQTDPMGGPCRCRQGNEWIIVVIHQAVDEAQAGERPPIGFLGPLDQLLAPNPRNSRWETNANLHVVATHPLLLFV